MPDTIEIKHKTVTQIAKIVNDNMTRYNAHQTLATLGWLVAGPFMFKPTEKYKQTLLRHLKVSEARVLTQKHIDMFTSPERTYAVLGEPFESVGEHGMNKFLLGNMATPLDVGNGRSLYTDSFVIATINKLWRYSEGL